MPKAPQWAPNLHPRALRDGNWVGQRNLRNSLPLPSTLPSWRPQFLPRIRQVTVRAPFGTEQGAIVKTHLRFLAFSTFLMILFAAGGTWAQLAPAAVAIAQGGPGEYYFFGSQAAAAPAGFIYLNYGTGAIDAILPTIAPNGTFFGTSQVTGLSVSGRVLASTVNFTYNGFSGSASKASSYGPTRRFAGGWLGTVVDPSTGTGSGEAVITSQGQMVVFGFQNFITSAGIGTINSSGSFSVPLLNGTTISGVFTPSFGRFSGTFHLSTGGAETAALGRAVPSRLSNISTRGFVGTGEQVLIGGFIISDGGKTVFIDAKGPSLAASGVTNPVHATRIDLHRGSQVIASNNGWRNNANSAEIMASGLAPTDDRESALQVALEPGNYTVIVSSGDSSTGVGLVEVFGVGDAEGP
jgi:hypothetical protein